MLGVDTVRLQSYKDEQRHYDMLNFNRSEKTPERQPPPINAYWPPANWTAEQIKAEVLEAENERRERAMDSRGE